MRVRAQTPSGDYTFGNGSGNFLVNSPALVAQLVLTQLRLLQGEWFLDQTAGTPWLQSVLGYGTLNIYDLVIQAAILGVPGVQSIESYSSALNSAARSLTVNATIDTIYGSISVTFTQPPG